MKQLVMVFACAALVTSGCAHSGMMTAGKGCRGPACHVARTQSAPRPNIMRTAYCDSGGCALGGGCDSGCYDDCAGGCPVGCGCPDTCCEGAEDCGCGCPDEYCDCTADCGCGCPGDCGCDDPCAGGGYGCCGDGSCCGNGRGICGACGGQGCSMCKRMVGAVASGFCPHSGGYPEMYNYNPGPPVGQVAYPYYTVRGPRDFLQSNPPSIGPY